jgi:hypothetical protein
MSQKDAKVIISFISKKSFISDIGNAICCSPLNYFSKSNFTKKEGKPNLPQFILSTTSVKGLNNALEIKIFSTVILV